MNSKKSALLILPILLVISLSGCTGIDPSSLARSNPIIKQFLEEHPNAEIKITHFTAEQSKNIIDQIRKDCDNPYIDEKEFYRIIVNDTETGFFAVAWIDWKERVIECAYKVGSEGKVVEKPKPQPICESHSYYKCDSGHIYWFDSCGNKQEKKEYCKYGCSGEKCLGECKSHAEYRCYGDYVYWFDSCGNKQEKKEYCEYGCENGFCKPKPQKVCEDAGGYCILPSIAGGAESIGQAETTGMVIATETTAASTRISYQCKEGYYASPNYFCKEGGMCCLPKEEFCGFSTYGPCSSDSDCVRGGCSGEVCQSVVNENPVPTTCEWKDCYNADKYGFTCKCVMDKTATKGSCQWAKSSKGCPEDIKVCTDGTTVGRDPNKNCEFYPCPSQTKQYYYRNAYWQCHDGKEFYEGGETSCKPAEVWRKYAEESCLGRCNTPTATSANLIKCGVNTFKVWNECSERSLIVKEQVKCVFINSNEMQNCYNEDGEFGCSGIGTCIADVSGEKGKKLTWKSSCGGYAYTLIDGENEYAEFKCESPSKTCANEGERFSQVYKEYPEHCCEGLTEWMSGMDTRIVQNGACVETGMVAGSPIGTCIRCGDGICSQLENVCNCPQDCQQLICNDSDGGKDYYVKGTTYGVLYTTASLENYYKTYTDNCSPETGSLIEYYCSNNGYVFNEWYKCPNGCVDGACA